MNSYILSFDPLNDKLTPEQLFHFIKDNRKIFQWHSPFLGTFMLKSPETRDSITEMFRGMFAGSPYIVSTVFPHMQVGGALQPEIWTWFNTSTFPTAPGGLLGAAGKKSLL